MLLGGSIKTDADEYVKEAAGLRIEALYVGGTEVALKSGTLSPNMLIVTQIWQKRGPPPRLNFS